MIDLDRYFRRTGYDGPVAPTLDTLNGIMYAHVQAIPFENLDVLLGRGIDLSPDALQQKLVVDRRGGYCFEQNGLLLHVLQELGFAVTPLSARVRYQRPRDYTPPARTCSCASRSTCRLARRRRRRRLVIVIRDPSGAGSRAGNPTRAATHRERERSSVPPGPLWRRMERRARVHGRGDAADRSRARQLVHQCAPAIALQESPDCDPARFRPAAG